MYSTRLFSWLPLLLVAALVGCNGDVSDTARPAADDQAASSVELTGEVIEVEMISDPSRGELFLPSDITARQGDVLRFVLVSGVHNARFPEDRNPGATDLPDASPYLQAPGQTHDMVVTMGPGEYEFVCDPHIPLGMIGTVTVVE